MDFSTDTALADLQTGFAQIYALAVSYSFSVLGAVMLIVVGWMAAGLAERSILAGLGNIRGFDATLRHFLSKLARYAVLILVVVMVLGQFGVQTASIIAAIGAIGLAIGLALQGTLQNIAAGIMLLALRPFRIGESIEVGSVAGDVEEIGLFATRLRAVDGTYILAPNSKLWNEPVRNSSRNRARRNDIVVSIAYDVDIDLAQKLMTDLASADPRAKKQPAPIAFIDALAETAVSLRLRYWTSDKDFLRARIDLTRLVKATFDANGVAFAAAKPESATTAAPRPAPAASTRTRQ